MEPIAIGKPHPQSLGRIVCECGWDYWIQETDTKEEVEAISWDHHNQEHGNGTLGKE